MGQGAVEEPTFPDRQEFRRWTDAQPRGRWERMDGRVVAMVPAHVAHVRVKARVWRAMDRAVRAAGLPYEVFGDGATVEVGDGTDLLPDALVAAGPRLLDDAVAVPEPVVVMEVVHPLMRSLDTSLKLAGYLSLPSVRHVLVVRADRQGVMHHHRRHDGGVGTRLLTAGPLTLDPPGIAVALEEFYAD